MCGDQAYRTSNEELVLAVSLELAAAKWKVALHDGRRERPAVHTVAQPQAAARLQAVLDLIERHKVKWLLPAGVRIVVSYEAGQDAFWIYRALQAQHIECYVVDPASIPVERHKRRAKTDRLDAIKLVINLRAWLRGERDRMHVVHVPSPQDEASRHLMRDRGQLQKEVLQHRDRMRKLLATLGCWDEVEQRTSPAGSPAARCGVTTARRCRPNCASGCCASANGWHWPSSNSRRWRRPRRRSLPAPARKRSDDLARLKGIGRSGRVATRARTVLAGLRQPPRSRGVRRAGATAVRQWRESGRPGDQQTGQPTGARVTGRDGVDLAALPARQRADALVLPAHAGRGPNRRARRIAIVAVARRLAIALWRYLKDGVVPEGAQLKPA